jgi:plastocyanin
MTRLPRLLPILVLLLLAAAAPAHAAEQKMTLYSDPIDVKPYSGEQHSVAMQGPTEPGWITSIKVDVVKKRSASAKKLSIQDVMIHHIVLHAFGAKWASAGNCAAQFFAMGEETQEMPKIGNYGIANMRPNGKAPNWALTHMLMNHRAYEFTVYVRTTITYSDTPKTELTPLWMDTARTPNGGPTGCDVDPTFTVPGGAKKGSNYIDDAVYTVPEDGRIIGAQGHLHGGGRYQTVTNLSCDNRRLWRSQAYYAMPNHIFYNVRPILHEPSPVSMSRTVSPQGIPVSQGDQLRLRAVYDNQLPHTRVMSIMMAYMAPGDVEPCEASPDDLITQDVPKHYRKPYPPSRVPLMAPPKGAFAPLGDGIDVRDYFFKQRRVVVKRGTPVTWRFDGSVDHDVAVANGPRGFSSPWIARGEFTYTPKKRGTYGLFCTLHPGYMSQELKVE